ncbi:nitronate monooxygenase family protein [Microaerobacter geothermalis]|uniref:NAD(P)H-dependent flavin oxidoreductase n=1 Tax=Microaerobacter geothermalis TaxID=674972 RepID=UPI001F34286C|nr:nitronate monooxygenase family protein [Microaerobacter geothermalis]MCF6094860.1 nitronate monooxygenase family protein [Microaerobacter geothermalis]
MLQTKITEMFGIKYPIIQGGLQGLGTSSLVSAVSESGGLGLITAGSYRDRHDMKMDIRKVREKTAKPFGVNLTIGIRRSMDEFVEGVLEEKIPIVFTSGANPEKYIPLFKKAGIQVVHVVPSVRYAKKAEELGCNAVVVVGYECGGHPGLSDQTSLTLIPQAVKEVSIPVIAAGGFCSGRSLLAALSLGAEGVQMGTCFLATKENPLHPKIKEKVLKLNEDATVIIKRSLRKPARVMKTEVSEKVLALEEQGAGLEELLPYIGGEAYNKVIKTGDLSKGVISLGQVVTMIDKILSVDDLIKNMIEEAETLLEEMSNKYLKYRKEDYS